VTAYVPLDPGDHTILVKRVGRFSSLESFDVLTAPVDRQEIVLRARISLIAGQYYSFSFFSLAQANATEETSAVASGIQGGADRGWRLYIDEFHNNDQTKAHFRYLPVSRAFEEIDVWLLAGESLTSTDLGTPLYSNLGFLADAPYMELDPGLYTLFVRQPGSNDNIIAVENIRLGGGNIYSSWGIGRVDDPAENLLYTAILKYDNWILVEGGFVCPTTPGGTRTGTYSM